MLFKNSTAVFAHICTVHTGNSTIQTSSYFWVFRLHCVVGK